MDCGGFGGGLEECLTMMGDDDANDGFATVANLSIRLPSARGVPRKTASSLL